MRFASFAIAALVGAVSTKSIVHDQLTSLKSLVRSTGDFETNSMVLAISDRKAQLERGLDNGTMDRQVVAEEMRFLLALVRDVESNDQVHAVQTLTSRKAALTQLTEGDQEGDEPAEIDMDALQQAIDDAKAALEAAETVETEAEADVTEAGDDVTDEQTQAVTDATADVATKQTALDDAREARDDALSAAADAAAAALEAANGELDTAQATFDAAEITLAEAAAAVEEAGDDVTDEQTQAVTDATAAVDAAQTALTAATDAANEAQETADAANEAAGEDTEEESGSGGMIAIVSVVAAIAVVGGCVCYRNKQNSENEGGAKEDKKLFKKVFKGKVQKKATKEEMVPSFAVPQEETV